MSNYDMTIPCDNCPFRKEGGIPLHESRVHEIVNADGEFPCHKTVDYDDEGDGVATAKSKVCAGFLIFLEKQDRPNQMMRISERLRIYDPAKFRDQPVCDEIFDDEDEMVAAGEGR